MLIITVIPSSVQTAIVIKSNDTLIFVNFNLLSFSELLLLLLGYL